MICKPCEEKGHYWFAPEWEDNEEGMDAKTTKKVGIYGHCDMRQVYATGVGCQCGCHKKNKPVSKVLQTLPFNSGIPYRGKTKKGTFAKRKGIHMTPVQRASKVYAVKGKKRWCPANFPESYMPLKKIKKK